MADSWGKVYVFNATGESVVAYFNDPARTHFTALRDRFNTPPYLPSGVAVPRGSEDDGPGHFWNQTSARFEGFDGQHRSWVAEYDAIDVPTADDQNTPISIADDLVLYVFRKWVVLYDTHGFKLEALPADSYSEPS